MIIKRLIVFCSTPPETRRFDMKRTAALTLALFLLLSCTACAGAESFSADAPPQTNAVLTGKIVSLGEGTVLLAGTDGAELYTLSSGLPVYDDSGVADAGALRAGQMVGIGFGGDVMESYPAQLENPAYIRVTAQEDNLVGFYLSILRELWTRDEALNPTGDEVLAFDLSALENLTESEKGALIYLAGCEFGVRGIAGTFDSLSAEGYIDAENLYFKNGLFVSFTLSDLTEDSFDFSVSKWRGGLAAYGFNGSACCADRPTGEWNYTLGAEWIS